MKYLLAAFGFISLISTAQAKDFALIASDEQRQSLQKIVDGALKGQGILAFHDAAVVLDMLSKGQEVVKKEDHPDAPPKDSTHKDDTPKP